MSQPSRRALLAGVGCGAAVLVGSDPAVAQAGPAAQAQPYDLLIKGGEVLDPSQGLRAPRDVAIHNAMIVTVEADIPRDRARQVIDVPGKLVCPGLVDVHAHVYPEVSALGLLADELVPWPCTTTYVSAGDAGANTFSLFRDAVVARARTRLFGLGACKPVGVCSCWGKSWAHGEKVSWWRSWCGG